MHALIHEKLFVQVYTLLIYLFILIMCTHISSAHLSFSVIYIFCNMPNFFVYLYFLNIPRKLQQHIRGLGLAARSEPNCAISGHTTPVRSFICLLFAFLSLPFSLSAFFLCHTLSAFYLSLALSSLTPFSKYDDHPEA